MTGKEPEEIQVLREIVLGKPKPYAKTITTTSEVKPNEPRQTAGPA